MREHIEGYYKSLFGPEESRGISVEEDFWANQSKLSNEEAEELVRPFTMTEIETALKDMDTSSAPGPDGLPAVFYKKMWGHIKDVVLEMFSNLHSGVFNMSRMNYGLITLIPKLKEANNIKQYRPICLLNVDYKWFTKVLTMRLAKHADKIISPVQTTFIPGRFILEGIVMLHEVLHHLRVHRRQGIILKLDFEKAYDKVQWGFMMEVLEKKNFPVKWIGWMKQVIEGRRVGIIVIGQPGNFFRTYKGLRQGDPLSPLLFNLVGDTLSMMLDKAKGSGLIRGLVPDLIEGGLTHLQYADDTILFLDIDEESICNTKFLLYCFEALSGLKINYQKSEIFVLEATIERQREIADLFNCNIGAFPMKYLGVMLDRYYMSSADFAYVYQKVEKRVPTWQSCLLSYGGKMILTESCLSIVPKYVMGVFHLKGEAHHKMETARANFFWHGPGQKKKYHLMRWEVERS